jgi:murein DD-endopeptidase MepM/ murein hydrolase activator NlpD
MKKIKSLIRIIVTLFGVMIIMFLLGMIGSGTSRANSINNDMEVTYEVSNMYGDFMTKFYPVITGKNIDFNKLPSDSIQIYLNKILDLYPNISPIKTYDSIRISSKFGWRLNPYNKKTQFHTGVDINMVVGTKIHSTMSGEIEKIEYSKYGYGNYIIIKNSLGFETLYAHLNRISVKKGQQVDKGQLIATLGVSGNATGPNLHYEVHQGGDLKNPLVYFYIDTTNTDLIAKNENKN